MMEQTILKSNFIVTAICWHEYTSKLIFNCAKLYNLLNSYLSIEYYGSSVQKIAFALIVEQEGEESFHEEFMNYNEETKRCYGQFRLSAEIIETMTEEELLPILAEVYHRRIVDFAQLEIPDMDFIGLQQAIGDLFEQAELLVLDESF